MLPHKHILLGGLFSIILALIFPQITWLGALVIFLASVFIDVDHYLYYVYKKHDWNLRKSIKWFVDSKDTFNSLSRKQKDQIYTGICFLHGLEALVLLILFYFILSYSNPSLAIWIIYIIIGFVFHQILDIIDIYRQEYRFDKVISLIYSIKNAKGKKLIYEYSK